MGIPMSKDRVSFLIPFRQDSTVASIKAQPQTTALSRTKRGRRFGSGRIQDTDMQALELAFGMNPEEAERIAVNKQRVVCRPSQFARFIVIRCRLGGSNQIRTLDPCLHPTLNIEPVDVSGRSEATYDMMHGHELAIVTGQKPMLNVGADLSELDGGEH